MSLSKVHAEIADELAAYINLADKPEGLTDWGQARMDVRSNFNAKQLQEMCNRLEVVGKRTIAQRVNIVLGVFSWGKDGEMLSTSSVVTIR